MSEDDEPGEVVPPRRHSSGLRAPAHYEVGKKPREDEMLGPYTRNRCDSHHMKDARRAICSL